MLAWFYIEKCYMSTDRSPLDSEPTTPLPDKKKDTYGVFSEPVDPNELPDYHEIIERPMDSRTVRKKLEEGRYSNLDEFQTIVLSLEDGGQNHSVLEEGEEILFIMLDLGCSM
ncbi:hypothetical protein ACSBR1_012337 [Camellia fascicularis]